MRFVFFSLLMITSIARGELGGLTNPAAKPKPKPKQETSYRTGEQDKQYQATQDAIDKGYNQQTTAVNSPKYEEYLDASDARYKKVLEEIDAGRSGDAAGPLLTYTPEKVPDGTPTGTATTTAHSSGTVASTTSSTPAETYKSPQDELIRSYCPSVCGQISDEQRAYACKSDCARTASMMSQPEPKEDNTQMLALIMNDLRQ